MGCDIHGFIQIRKPGGTWKRHATTQLNIPDDRHYGVFAALAGVRGEPTHVTPELRGWVPDDDDTRQICWPWNLVRDRRTPRASLPGADLVGFCKEGDTVLLLFGEVKTSSDARTPPNVMNGSGGMAWQLKDEATRLDIQHALLQWLRARCESSEHRALYQAAVQRYVQSLGKEILLVGILLRDTEPNELDVTARAKSLAESLGSPTRIEITAWYLPIPIEEWPTLLHEGAP